LPVEAVLPELYGVAAVATLIALVQTLSFPHSSNALIYKVYSPLVHGHLVPKSIYARIKGIADAESIFKAPHR